MTAYKQVPLEPTPEMIEAAYREHRPKMAYEDSNVDFARDCYRAMLAAAPEPSAESEKTVEMREALAAIFDMIENCADVPRDPDSLLRMVHTIARLALSNKGG